MWEARQISLDRIVAIKILSSRLAGNVADVERFHKEAQSAAKLKHRGIVQIHDANAHDGLYYFVMEYVAGYSVGEWLRQKGWLPEKDVLLVADCVADALGYAWDRERIIHCDVKPDNIMIDSDGTVKVADLGLARTINRFQREADSDEVTGTPAYMSPEQAHGETSLDCRSDMYSLGATMYHLLTGRMMFPDASDEETVQMQISAEPEPPGDVNMALSAEVVALVRRLLQKDPEKRFGGWQTARAEIVAVRGKLQDSRRGIGATAAAKNVVHVNTDRLRRLKRRGLRRSNTRMSGAPVVIAGIAVAAALVVVALWAAGRMPRRRPTERRPSPAVTDRGPTAAEQQSEALEKARAWWGQNPGRELEAIRRFSEVARMASGTAYAGFASRQARTIEKEWTTRRLSEILVDLDRLAGKKARAGDLAGAAAVYAGYDGEFARETREHRLAKAEALREGISRAAAEAVRRREAAAQRVESALDLAARKIALGETAAARDVLERARAELEPPEADKPLRGVVALLGEVLAVDRKILDSFAAQKEQAVTAELLSGRKSFIVTEVKDGTVFCEAKPSTSRLKIGMTFCVNDLSAREKLSRLGSDEQPYVAVFKGQLALKSGRYAVARECFERVGSGLAHRLAAVVDAEEARELEETAARELHRLLKALDMNVGPYNEKDWLDAIAKRRLSRDDPGRVRERVAAFHEEFAGTRFLVLAAPVLRALEGREEPDPHDGPVVDIEELPRE